jgi:two-component system, LuxR family, sensor histidine kinase DctS
MLVVAQTLLVRLTVGHESQKQQERTEAVALEVASQVKQRLVRTQQGLQELMWTQPTPEGWRAQAANTLREFRELRRIEWRLPNRSIKEAQDSPQHGPLFKQITRSEVDADLTQACQAARRSDSPMFSRSFFIPFGIGQGLEVIDLCIPLQEAGKDTGYLVATLSLPGLLEAALPDDQARSHEFSFIESDGARLARAGMQRGSGVYVAERVLDLPGSVLQLRVDSLTGRPSLIPNLTTALVLGLSLALFGMVMLLALDVRKRARTETALAEALAFRKAMEDSLITGLRARDLKGRVTYANPAFCQMVGHSPEALQGQDTPPYWPPEQVEHYRQRQGLRLDPTLGAGTQAREGFETVFMRSNGERFPVMIFEAPLLDNHGHHTGWMSAVLDISTQRRVEELSRQQQERLQATARLATVGEMASLLSHELNQPLAAIASYAAGSLNMADDPDGPALMREGLGHIADQAQRAGRVIKSVHDFVRRREQLRETMGVDLLFAAVQPLIALQARKSGAQIVIDLPAKVPRVVCDRTMLEQVLLNLARNGLQAMEGVLPTEARVLTLRARQTHERWVLISVIDAGSGIGPEVARQLFTPFFTTRPEGMGLGLSLCRTVVEQHGGQLDFESPAPGEEVGTVFRFTLASPVPKAPASPT